MIDVSLKTLSRKKKKKSKNMAHAKNILSVSNEKPFLFFFFPRCHQLPKQMGAVMNEINTVDGISGTADLTPRAGVKGAGAAQIYSPPPPDISFLIHRR